MAEGTLPGTFPPACPPCARPRRARARARARPSDPAVGCSRDASGLALRISRRRGRARARGRVAHDPGRQVRAHLAAERGLVRVAAPHSGRARPRRPRGGLGRARGAGRTPVRGEADALGPRETVRARFADEQRRGRVRRGDQRRAGAPSRLPERPRDARDASEDQAQPPRRAPRGAGGGDRAGAQDEPARARRTGGRSVSRNRARLRSRREELERGPGGGDGGPVRLRRVRGGGGEGHGESSGTLALAGVVGGSRDAADVGPGGDGRGRRPIADAEPLFGPGDRLEPGAGRASSRGGDARLWFRSGG